MADEAKATEFTFKVMINKQKTKVLFAEVDSSFADVLLSFLTLPLGKIVRLLKKHFRDEEAPVNIGSLTSLCNGVSNLNNVCFPTEGCKEMLLNPRSLFEADCCKLKLDIHETRSTKYFLCENLKCYYFNASINCDTARCSCGKSLNREVDVNYSLDANGTAAGVFTINTASFLIADDLRIVPNVSVSIMQTLGILGITDIDGAELMNVTFGFNEIMDLLNGSLLSRTPLTDIILNKGKIGSATNECESETPLHQIEKEADNSNSKKMNLKLMVQECTNKLLFAQAEDDFIDFLFSLLTIPLGGVLDCILGSSTSGLKSIDNLYRSIADLIDDKYLVTSDTKARLMKPQLPHKCLSKNQILPLTPGEKVHRRLYYSQGATAGKDWLSYSEVERSFKVEVVYPKGRTGYVKGPKMYMVTDNLTVTPLCMISSLSKLKEMKIPLSDVKEVEVQIGLQEALSILKASLTSTSALTDGLMIKPVSNKKPKLEH